MKLNIKHLVVYSIIALVAVAAFVPMVPGGEQKVEAQGTNPYQFTVRELMQAAEQIGPSGIRGVTGRVWEMPEEVEDPVVKTRVNPASPLVSSYSRDGAPSAATGPLVAEMTEGLNFTSFTLDELGQATGGGLVPPDTMGVIGPTQFVTNVNGWFRVHDKETGAVGALDVWDELFWCPNGEPGVPPCVLTEPDGEIVTDVGISDPRVRYDRHTGRWFFIIIDIPFTSTGDLAPVANRQLVAWTDGPIIDEDTVFTLSYFVHDQSPEDVEGYDDGAFLDYPTLGIDVNALYIGGNMFGGQFGFNSTMWVIPKDSLLASGGGDIVDLTYAFRRLQYEGSGSWSPHAPDSFDPNQETGWWVGASNFAWGTIDVCEVYNPDFEPGVSTPSYECVELTVPNTNWGIPVPHPAGGTGLDFIDDRLMMASIRDGKIWTAHTVGVDSTGVSPVSYAAVDRNASRWYEIDVSQGLGNVSLVQAGTVYDSSATDFLHYWMPSVNVSGQGHAVVGFSAANANTNPGAAWTYRLVDDALGTTRDVSIYQPGVADYPTSSGRWGDYSMTSLDPCDDMTLWTIQEFSDTPTVFGLDWAVQALEVIAPQPAEVLSVSPEDIPSGEESVMVTLTGDLDTGYWYALTTPEALVGQEYCPNSVVPASPGMSVEVGNGVVVVDEEWVDADTVILELDTTGATPGNPDFGVTNPDSQSVSTDCVLSIDGVTDDNCAVIEPTDDPGDQPGPGLSDPALSKVGILGPGQLGLPGEQITWVITVNNTSGANLTNVVITDTLINALQIDGVNTTTGSASVSGQTVTVVIPFLGAGESAEIQIATTVLSNPGAPSFVNTATLTADSGFTATATGSVPAPGGLPDTGYPPEE